jgi:hypothetical protein
MAAPPATAGHRASAGLLALAAITLMPALAAAFEGTLRWRVIEVPPLVLETLVAGSIDDPQKAREGRILVIPEHAGEPADAPYLLIDPASGTTVAVDAANGGKSSWNRDDPPEPAPEDDKRAKARVAFEGALEAYRKTLPDDQQQQLTDAVRDRPEAFGLGAVAAQPARIRRVERGVHLNGRTVATWDIEADRTVARVWLDEGEKDAARVLAEAARNGAPPGQISPIDRGLAQVCANGLPVRMQRLSPSGYRIDDLLEIDPSPPAESLFVSEESLEAEGENAPTAEDAPLPAPPLPPPAGTAEP